MFQVPGPRWRWTPPSNPGVATLCVLEIFFSLADDFLVCPAIGVEGVAVKTLCPLFVILAEGLGVQQDDRDLAPAIGAAAVGWEGEDSDLIFNLRG